MKALWSKNENVGILTLVFDPKFHFWTFNNCPISNFRNDFANKFVTENSNSILLLLNKVRNLELLIC
jgi:hypothetical protein